MIREEKRKEEQQVNLAQLKVNDFSIVLNNKTKQLKSTGVLRELELNGKFSNRNTQIKGALEGFLEEVSNRFGEDR